MRSATTGRTATVTRLAAISAASVLVIGLLPPGPAAATTLDTVAKIADALCPGGAGSTGTAVLSQNVTSDLRKDADNNDEFKDVLEVAADCVATLDLYGRKLSVRSINLGAGSTLTIKDSVGGGELLAEGAAARNVSGVPGIDAGGATLIIKSGKIDAKGASGRAGIRTTGGNLRVEGGDVDAVGGSGAPGIGASAGNDSDAGTVMISGGTVMATGTGAGAGIGGRAFGDGGTVRITGGSVVATAGNADAKAIGIGAGGSDDGQLTLGPRAVPVFSFTAGGFPVTSITFVPVVRAPTPAGPSFFAPGGVQPSQPVASAAVVRADGSPQELAASAPGRDQVRYEADGIRITLEGGPGTGVARGLVANPAGEVVCEVCIANLVAGQVVEVWLFSTPRLVAAHLIEDAECQLFAVPLSAPLDGDGPVAAGAHTLQFTLATASGREAVNVGLTVGSLVPVSMPAGEGPVTPYPLAVLLLLVAALGIRRAAAAKG